MKKNEGPADRAVRVILGIILIAGGIFLLEAIWKILAIIIGAILLITGLTGFCTLYKVFGINTTGRKTE